jgi:benzoylformate decarboxylase
MPAAVGIALADPSRPVLCLIGDGGAMYSPQAIWTAVQQRVPVTFLVLNNAGYGSMKGFAALHGVSTAPSFDLPGLDLAVLARGMGCEAHRVTTPDELLARLAMVGTRDLPLLLDVQLGTEAPEFA